MTNNNSLATGHPYRPWRSLLLGTALVAGTLASAQVVFNETFTGGASTAGFTIAQSAGTCTWTYNNPGARDITGAGFDADFAIFDSDYCGSDGDSAAANLVSPVFDASGPGNYVLSFDQQYRDVSPTIAIVEVWDGTNWNEVYNTGNTDVGYPDPAVNETINITDATGGYTAAQVRFHYGGDWRWWWAVDNINLTVAACAAPGGLAVTGPTTSGGTVVWTDNGSTGYQWAVTAGAVPNGSNELASGDGSNTAITGLSGGTTYTVWVRSDCGDGTFSPWSSGVAFTTLITNDECSGAMALTVNPDYNCGSVTAGTINGATDSGITSTCGGTADDDVWFSFVATATTHRISLENITGSTTDMFMALWAGDCSNLSLVPDACSDPESMVVAGLTPGHTYYLQVYSWTDEPGQTSAFQVCVGTPPPPPANDECSGALALTVNPNYSCASVTAGTIAGATGSNVTSTCGGTADDDVWYSFVATDTLHRISLENINGSTSDMYMALYTGDCGNLVEVPGSCSDPESMDVGGLTIGTTYYLQVYTWTDEPGQTSRFDVCVGTEPFCQPPLAITLDSISAPNATVSFTENTATQYQYELRVSGDVGSGATGLVASGIISGSPLDLTGLVADSLYVVYIRSICSVGDTSAWSDGLNIIDGYCNTITFLDDVEPICNVTFAGIDNSSSSEVNGSPALEDFTDHIAYVGQGGTYPITVTGNTNGDYTTYVTAFFDWNQDQIFETSVPIGSFTNTVCGTPITATVDVPADAMIGTTRMRVVKNYNSSPTDPCASYSFGQAEDYSVNVGTVGVAEVGQGTQLAVYPNPASTELHINALNGQPAQVQVFDMVGHLAMELTSNGSMDIRQLAPGSYSLLITSLDGTRINHARFVKQ
jgi:hypothetical protein